MGFKSMKKLGFACLYGAALALAACGRDDADTLNETPANMEAGELNALADNAAADAEAEMEALGNQQQQAEADNAAAAAAANTQNEADTTTEPSEVEDDVQGM